MSTLSNDQAELIRLAILGIDAQVRELQQKRAELLESAGGPVPGITKRRGRPPGTANAAAAAAAPAAPAKQGKKRTFSEETRQKLSVKAKARWEREKTAPAPEKPAAKKKGGGE